MKGKRLRGEFGVWSPVFGGRSSSLQTTNCKLQTKIAPCAGITLIRFCGFDLSRTTCVVQHPGNTEKLIVAAKIAQDNFYWPVTF